VADNSIAKLILPVFSLVSNNCAHGEILYRGMPVGIKPLANNYQMAVLSKP
jgi:hypothetical protein